MVENLRGGMERGEASHHVCKQEAGTSGAATPYLQKKPQHYKGSLAAHIHPGRHARASEAAAFLISTPASDLLSHLRQVI